MKVAIYARVSTADQNYEGQLEELHALAERSGWEVVDVYSEKISGTKATDERPELKRMMKDARLRKFEKVLVWSVDFLGIFSEFENTIRKERQVVGIRKAKERGVCFGRKPTTEAQIDRIRWMRKHGSSIRAICQEVKVSPNTVYAAL